MTEHHITALYACRVCARPSRVPVRCEGCGSVRFTPVDSRSVSLPTDAPIAVLDWLPAPFDKAVADDEPEETPEPNVTPHQNPWIVRVIKGDTVAVKRPDRTPAPRGKR